MKQLRCGVRLVEDQHVVFLEERGDPAVLVMTAASAREIAGEMASVAHLPGERQLIEGLRTAADVADARNGSRH